MSSNLLQGFWLLVLVSGATNPEEDAGKVSLMISRVNLLKWTGQSSNLRK